MALDALSAVAGGARNRRLTASQSARLKLSFRSDRGVPERGRSYERMLAHSGPQLILLFQRGSIEMSIWTTSAVLRSNERL
jgi:hypothetical protein